MTRYSFQPNICKRLWIFSFANNMGKNNGKNISKNHAKQSATDALKTASKRVI